MVQSGLTRREVIGKGLQLSALAAVFLTGCGGFLSGGSGGGASSSVTGTFALPNGIAMADVSIVGLGKVSPLTATGFQTLVSGNAPSFVLAVHGPTEKVIGMAIFDSTDAVRTMDATSAAVALLFMALDGSALPADGRKALLDLIKSHSATATLAGVIQTQLNSDPYALETANSTLQSAVSEAAHAIASASPGVARPSARPFGLQTLMLVEPSNEIDGLTVVQADNNLAYQVQNSRRRSSLMYTYLVAHVDDNGTRTDITPQQVGNVLEIPATNSLLNLSSGWHPKTSIPVSLKLEGNDRKSIYELVALNTVFGANDPAVYDLDRYAGAVSQWKQDVQNLHATMVLSYVAGIMFDAIGIGGITWGIAELTATITNLTATTTNLVSLLVGAQDGYALIPLTKTVIQRFLTGSFLSPAGVEAFQPLLAKAEGQVAADLAAGQASASVYVAMRAALRIFLAVGVIGLAADLVAVAKDTSTGERGDLFTVTLFEPKVALSPANGSYSPGTDMTIEAQAPGVAQSHLSYHWKLSGSNLANLSDGTNVGLDFTSTSKTVNLATTPSTQGNLAVTVTVTDTTTSTVVGTATAVYSVGAVQNYSYIQQPFGPNGYYPQGGGDAIAYIPVKLTGSEQILHVDAIHDLWGDAHYKIKIPPASTAIDHTANVTSAQLYGGTAGVVQGRIYDYSYHGTEGYSSTVFNNSITWWNYGDELWLVVGVGRWDNRGASAGVDGNGGDAITTVKGFAAKWHITIEPV